MHLPIRLVLTNLPDIRSPLNKPDMGLTTLWECDTPELSYVAVWNEAI